MDSRKKHGLMLGFAAFGIFALSASAAFFLLPQVKIINELGDNPGDNPSSLTGKDLFLQNTLTSLGMTGGSEEPGLALDIETLNVDIPSKITTVDEDGQSVVTTYHNRISKAAGRDMSLRLALSELSLAGINLAAELPLDYNGELRELDLGLLGGVSDKNLYFTVADIDPEDDPEQTHWNAGYQVSLSRYDTGEIDPLTGGTYSYEYGKLDFVIHDILEVLSGGSMQLNLDTYGGISSLITGSGASEETESESALDTDALLSALDTIEETVGEDGNPYFTLNLPLGEVELSLGLSSDASYHLDGLDIPSKTADDDVLTILDDISIELHASVSTKADDGSFTWDAPAAWKSLPKLDDSLALFRDIASYVANPQFGLSLDIDMKHYEEGTAGTYTTFGKDEISEEALLSLEADVDLGYKKENGSLSGVDFRGIDAGLTFSRLDPTDGSVKSTQNLGVTYLNDDSDYAGMYLNFADVLKTRGTRTMLDELIGKFTDTEGESAEEEKESVELSSVLSTVKSVVKLLQGSDDIENSKILENLEHGHYEKVLELIKDFAIEDNRIAIVLTLEDLGFHGCEIELTLDGTTTARSLVSLEIHNLELLSLTLDITLSTKAYQEVGISAEQKTWGAMNHLPSLGDQIKEIAENKKIELGIAGKIENENVFAPDGDLAGLHLNGRAAFDFSAPKSSEENPNPLPLQGTLDLTLIERNADYLQDHNLALDIKNLGATLDGQDNLALFHYDSKNDVASSTYAAENRTEPVNQNGLEGKYGIYDIGGVIDSITDVVERFSGDEDHQGDSRFSRISTLLGEPAGASLLSDLTSGNVFKLADYSILKSASIGEEKDEFVLDGSVLGLDNDISLSLAYDPKENDVYGGLQSLGIATKLGDVDGEKTLIDIGISLNEVTDSTSFSTLGLFDGTSSSQAKIAGMDDYTALNSLIDYLGNTLALGLVNGEALTSYALEGTVGLKLGAYEMQLAKANINASWEGARVKMQGELNDIPVIRGLNAPDHEHYFRPLELGGSRDASFYYYADGLNNSKMLMTRHTDYGKLSNVNDSLRFGDDAFSTFKDDAVNYLLEYFLGVNEELFNQDEEDSTVNDSTIESSKAKPFHIEDLFKGLSSTMDASSGEASWTLKVNLNALLGIDILDDISLTIGGGKYAYNGNYFKAINRIHAEAGVSLSGKTQDAEGNFTVEGDRLSLLEAVIDLRLTNLDNGIYENAWPSLAASAYAANFLSFASNGDFTEMGTMALPTSDKGGAAWNHEAYREDETHVGVNGKRNYYLFP